MKTGAIQAAVAPVILISANSLFLLTLANRYTNLTTRIRQVSDLQQIEALYRRVLILKSSIVLNIVSIILQVLVVCALLVITLTENNSAESKVEVADYMFFGSLIIMTLSAVTFLMDIGWSSSAIERHVRGIRQDSQTTIMEY